MCLRKSQILKLKKFSTLWTSCGNTKQVFSLLSSRLLKAFYTEVLAPIEWEVLINLHGTLIKFRKGEYHGIF